MAVRPDSAAVRMWEWTGAALFAASLGYCFFSYAVTFGEMATGDRRPSAIARNAGLFTAFALHHSLFARTPVRRAVARSVPPGLERTFYVVVASVLLVLVCALWSPLPGVAWTVSGAAAWMLRGAQLAGIWLTLRSAAAIDVRELAGLSSSTRDASSTLRDPEPAEFKAIGPYGWVRHPIYAGWLLMVWCAPVMTLTRLEFAVVSGAYLLMAIPFEERTLRATAGEPYAEYVGRVRWRLVPGVY